LPAARWMIGPYRRHACRQAGNAGPLSKGWKVCASFAALTCFAPHSDSDALKAAIGNGVIADLGELNGITRTSTRCRGHR
ncbi:MAG: hypothetical protein WBD65_06520, partial [Methylocella sp.]